MAAHADEDAILVIQQAADFQKVLDCDNLSGWPQRGKFHAQGRCGVTILKEGAHPHGGREVCTQQLQRL